MEVIVASEVPGGRSTKSVSSFPHKTSFQNFSINPAIMGPRQATAASSSFNIRLLETIRIPNGVTAGKIPISPPRKPPLGSPNIFGILAPVMSASRMPTFWPLRDSSTASIAVTDDFPTPPLPLITESTRPTRFIALSFGNAALVLPSASLRSSGVMAAKLICTSAAPGIWSS